MQKSRRLMLFMLLVLILITLGCSRNKYAAGETGSLNYTPEWWKTQSSYLHINSYGVGTELSRIASYDAARGDALLNMAQYVEVYVSDMMKKFEKEAGITDEAILTLTAQTADNAANARFSNLLVSNTETIIIKKDDGYYYKTFLQLMIPKFEINRSLLDKIHNDPALYDILRASQSFANWEKLLMNR